MTSLQPRKNIEISKKKYSFYILGTTL